MISYFFSQTFSNTPLLACHPCRLRAWSWTSHICGGSSEQHGKAGQWLVPWAKPVTVQRDKLTLRTSLRTAFWSRWGLRWVSKGRLREKEDLPGRRGPVTWYFHMGTKCGLSRVEGRRSDWMHIMLVQVQTEWMGSQLMSMENWQGRWVYYREKDLTLETHNFDMKHNFNRNQKSSSDSKNLSFH